MNDRETIPAPSEAPAARSNSAIELTKFGTIGFDLYKAIIVAEGERLYNNRRNQNDSQPQA